MTKSRRAPTRKKKLVATLILLPSESKTVSFSKRAFASPCSSKNFCLWRRCRARLLTVAIEVSKAPIERAARNERA